MGRNKCNIWEMSPDRMRYPEVKCSEFSSAADHARDNFTCPLVEISLIKCLEYDPKHPYTRREILRGWAVNETVFQSLGFFPRFNYD